MSNTKTIVLVSITVAVLVLGIIAKALFFPSVKDVYFATSQRTLLKAPPGLAVVRPTHFHYHRESIIYAAAGKDRRSNWRMAGRNVPLRDLMATAFGATAGRVVLPANAPTNGFDFVVTAARPRPSLEKAIRESLGYTADEETNDTDVLALKIADPALPGMTVSAADEKQGTSFKKGKLLVNHIKLAELTPAFEQFIKTPVVDETGLSNYYDVTIDWSGAIWMRLENGSTARPVVDKILKNWGLDLEPDTAPIKVLVVKKVY